MRRSELECKRKCGRKQKLYVAVSNMLHEPDRSRGRPWAGHYLFKVGVTSACHFRQATINGRKSGSQPWHDGDVYAGVSDWQIVHCWPASMRDEDKNGFRPWAEKQRFAVAPVVCDPSGRAREELYRLRPFQLTLVDWPATGHVLYDKIVNAAIRELRRRVRVREIGDLGPIAGDGVVVASQGEPELGGEAGCQHEIAAEDWVDPVDGAGEFSVVELEMLQAALACEIAAARSRAFPVAGGGADAAGDLQPAGSAWLEAGRLLSLGLQASKPH